VARTVWFKFTGFLSNLAYVLMACALLGVIWHNWIPIAHPAVKWGALGLPVSWSLAPFFFTAVKEWYEDMFLPGGDLYGWKKSALAVAACLGGIVVPMTIVKIIIWQLDIPLTWKAMFIATPTDIAVALAIANIFKLQRGPRKFLLSVAIIDDIVGIVMIAVFFGHGFHWWGLLILAAVLVHGYVMYRLPRRWQPEFTSMLVRLDGSSVSRVKYHLVKAWEAFASLANFVPHRLRWSPILGHWWYLPLGIEFMVSFHFTGIHATSAFALIILFMPHAARDHGLYEEISRDDLPDTLNRLEHALKYPVIVTVGFFAFMVMAIDVTTVTQATFVVFTALVVGKPIGIFLFSVVAMRLWGLRLADGMSIFDLLRVGALAGCGFTVALFIAQEYAHGDQMLAAELKLGAALTLFGSIAFLKLIDVAEYSWCKWTTLRSSKSQVTTFDQAD
jgi:NhaA family Na+:H+ antiporter